jgi:hypothetical protein
MFLNYYWLAYITLLVISIGSILHVVPGLTLDILTSDIIQAALGWTYYLP